MKRSERSSTLSSAQLSLSFAAANEPTHQSAKRHFPLSLPPPTFTTVTAPLLSVLYCYQRSPSSCSGVVRYHAIAAVGGCPHYVQGAAAPCRPGWRCRERSRRDRLRLLTLHLRPRAGGGADVSEAFSQPVSLSLLCVFLFLSPSARIGLLSHCFLSPLCSPPCCSACLSRAGSCIRSSTATCAAPRTGRSWKSGCTASKNGSAPGSCGTSPNKTPRQTPRKGRLAL